MGKTDHLTSNELLNRAKAIVNHGGGIVYPSRAAAQRVRDIIADLIKEIEGNNEVTARCYMRLQCADVPREPWHWEVCTTLDSTGIPSTHDSYDLVTRLQAELAEANKIIAHQSLSIWKQPTAHETSAKLCPKCNRTVTSGCNYCACPYPQPTEEKPAVSADQDCPTGDWKHRKFKGKCLYCEAPMPEATPLKANVTLPAGATLRPGGIVSFDAAPMNGDEIVEASWWCIICNTLNSPKATLCTKCRAAPNGDEQSK